MAKRYVGDGLGECLGSDLPPRLQAEALRAYVHRFTRDHVPMWAKVPRPDGTPYPVQFASDADWLAHTMFCVTRSRPMGLAEAPCRSNPTWPDGVTQPNGLKEGALAL